MSNPYTLRPVISPDYFVADRGGRAAQALRLYRGLRRVDPFPDSISIVGERRSGKTSLLWYLARTVANPPELLTATIDMLNLSPQNPDGFYAVLTRSLIRAKALPKDHPPLDYQSFEDFLWELNVAGQRFLLFIDEFDLVARDRQFDWAFFDYLRSLADNIDLPLVLVIASAASLAEIAHIGVYSSPFFNIFLKERLVPLSRQEAEALVAHPPGGQVGFGESAVEIMALAGCHPYFLQLACTYAWELREAAGGILNMSDLHTTFEHEAHTQYQYIWEHSSIEERNTLCALARDMPFNEDGISTLVERGYVIAGHPPRLFSNGFINFVTAQCTPAIVEMVKAQSGKQPYPAANPTIVNRMPVDDTAPARRLALVIGVNTYHYQQSGDYVLTPLYYAEQDAKEVTELLKLLKFDVEQLLGTAATYVAIQAFFTRMQQATMTDPHPESCFVLHFSGHGQMDPTNDQTAYLVLHDTDPRTPGTSGLEMTQLVYNFLPLVRVPNSLVLLDACHAGFAAGVKHIGPERGRLPNVTQQLFSNLQGRMVLAACAGEARTREQANLAHGVFTHYLLRHWRDLDGDHPDDLITFFTLFQYVACMMKNHEGLSPPAYSAAGLGSPFILRRIPSAIDVSSPLS